MIYKIHNKELKYEKDEFCYSYSNMNIINYLFSIYPQRLIDNDYVIENGPFKCSTLIKEEYLLDNYIDYDIIIFME